MNLREWARATHRALASQPPDERQKDLSAEDVERVLRMSITTLSTALVAGGDLRIDDLGRLWSETKRPRRVVSNLSGQPMVLTAPGRWTVRFRLSSRLDALLNSVLDIEDQRSDLSP